MAARTRSTSPVVMPPSVPPARPDRRRIDRPLEAFSWTISSWAAEPRTRASSKPSPISTPLIAWMPMSAPANRESRRRSQWVWLPRPGGRPYASTSTTPPRVSPAFLAASISAIMAASPTGSKLRTGDASTVSRSPGPGTWWSGASPAPPMDTTWLTISTPATWCRKALATAPTATRAAVSRALARSRMGRASSRSNFCMPTRSAWPGRGRVRASLRACAANTSASTGSAAITVSHLGHSLLPTRMATGPPMVTPWRTPPVSSTSSASNFIRAPRP